MTSPRIEHRRRVRRHHCGESLDTRAECKCERPSEAVQIGMFFGPTDAAGARYVRVAGALMRAGVLEDCAKRMATVSQGRPS